MEAQWNKTGAESTEDIDDKPTRTITMGEQSLMNDNRNTSTIAPTAFLVPLKFTNKSIMTRSKDCTVEKSVPTKYALRNNLALCKKRAACDREPYKVKHNKVSTTITMNTVAFECFRSTILEYLRSIKRYETKLSKTPDLEGSIVKEIIRVFDNISLVYTINIFTTTTRIMVNGPQYSTFIQEDIPILLNKIRGMREGLISANQQTKNYIETKLKEISLPAVSKQMVQVTRATKHPHRKTSSPQAPNHKELFEPIEEEKKNNIMEIEKTTYGNSTNKTNNTYKTNKSENGSQNEILMNHDGKTKQQNDDNVDPMNDKRKTTSQEIYEQTKEHEQEASSISNESSTNRTEYKRKKTSQEKDEQAKEEHEQESSSISNESSTNSTLIDNSTIDKLVYDSILNVAIQLYVEDVIERANKMNQTESIERLNPQSQTSDSRIHPLIKDIVKENPIENVTNNIPICEQDEVTNGNMAKREHEVELRNTESEVNTVRRSSRIGKPSPKTQQDDPNIKIAEDITHGVQEKQLSPICPGCETKVRKGSKGVVCEMCLAYWHYPCAGMDDKIVKDMGKADFYCNKHVSHRKPGTEEKQKSQETQVHKAKIEKELLLWKEKHEKAEKENKRSGKIIQEKEADKTKLMEEIKELKTNHEKFLKKNQILLDSLGNSIINLKKEKAKNQQTIKTAESKIQELKEKNENLVKGNKQLEEENKAHIEFVTNNITNQDTDILKKLKEENEHLKQQIEKHQKAELNVAQAKAKVSEKTKELNLNKEQIDALENRIGELEVQSKEYKRKLDVKSAEYEKEKDINAQLAKNTNVQKRLQEQQTQTTNEETIPSKNQNNNQRILQQKPLRGLCCHEVVEKGSCPFSRRCMFSHNVTDGDRQNRETVIAAEQTKMNYITRKQQKEERREREIEPDTIDVCEKAYWNGPNPGCTCSKSHNLDFDKIKRGTCQLYILGKCRRRENCWFSHEVPKSVREDETTIEKAKHFAEKRKKKYHNASNNTSNTRRDPGSVEGQMTNITNPQSQPSCPKYPAPTENRLLRNTSDKNEGQSSMASSTRSYAASLKYNTPKNNGKSSKSPENSSGQPNVQNNPTPAYGVKPQNITNQGYNCSTPQQVYVQNPLDASQQTEQFNTPAPAHNPFLLLVRSMIQDQVRQAMMPISMSAIPTQMDQYRQNQIFSA